MLATQAADSAPRLSRLGPWCLAVMALHAACLWPRPSAVTRTSAPVAAPASPLQWRAVALAPVRADPSTAARTAVPARSPRARPPVEPAGALQSGPPPDPPTTAAPLATTGPPVSLPGAARWGYVLYHEGAQGEAWLDWQREAAAPDVPGAERYRLVLHRRTEQRALPRWESRGELGAQGLAPQRFAVQRGKAGQRVIHEAEAAPTPQQQDRLSWMLQLPALLQARPETASAELAVVDWRGRSHPWRFERVGTEPVTLPDGQVRQAQRWRRVAQGQAQAEIELWLDANDGQRPLRLVHKVLGDERWELLWNPAASDGPR